MGTLPDIYTGIAWNAEPFDVGAVPVWADLSSRYLGTSSATRGGTQYELDGPQSGSADFTWLDPDEALNAQNPGSPYAGYINPNRPMLWRTMWPVGGTGNLVAGSSGSVLADGSFESYATTAAMQQWFSYLNGITSANVFSLVSAGAWQGTKAAQITNATSATLLCGGQCSVNLIPGRTYTAQAHVQQSLANAFQLAVGNQTVVVEPFGRTTVSGWGTPNQSVGYGTAWQTNGLATDFLTAGAQGFHSVSVVNSRRTMTSGTNNVYDHTTYATVSVPVVATGASIQTMVVGRWASGTSTYTAGLDWRTDGTLLASINKIVGGVTTTLVSIVLGTYAAGDTYRLKFVNVGTTLTLKAWKYLPTSIEPPVTTLTVTDASITTPGRVGCSTLLLTGNTNTLPVISTWSDIRSIGSIVDTVNGVTSTSGAYVLLKQTFVASQPFHTIQLETQAPNPSNITVLVDGVQVEPGSTANTFTTSGPSIRSPWTRGIIERVPAAWDPDSAGFLGMAAWPAVGPGALLQNANLHTEYTGAVLAKQPLYYWRLNEGSNATQFGESSGNGGPQLIRFDGSAGAAPTFSPGNASNLPGESGQNAPTWGGMTAAGITGTSLQTGPYNTPQISGIGQASSASSTVWAVTLSCWVKLSDNLGNGLGGLISLTGPIQPLLPSALFPIWAPSVGIAADDGFGNGPTISLLFQGQPLFFTPNPSALSVGVWHHVVGTFSISSASVYTAAVYTDGVATLNVSANISTIPWTLPLDSRVYWAEVNGAVDPNNEALGNIGAVPGTNGQICDVAVWSRALSAAEVTDLYQAGLGYPNENSGTRVARYIALAGFVNPNSQGSVDIGQGQTTMGPSALTEGTTASAAVQTTVETEFGRFWESPEGFTFRGRQARYLTTVATVTFGENVAGGEIPHREMPVYDRDPTYVNTAAQIDRLNGISAFAVDPTGLSQLRYGAGKLFTRTVGGNNDNEAIDAANYVVATTKDPFNRLASMLLDVAATRGLSTSDGTMWTLALTLDVSTRATVKRRAKAANSGAGITISGDFFLEAVGVSGVSIEAGTWQLAIVASPVPPAGSGGQPWILEDPTYSVLNSTTIPGF